MTHVAELGFLASALAEQARIGVRCQRMRVIRALFTTKIVLGIASIAGLPSRGRRTAAVLRNKAESLRDGVNNPSLLDTWRNYALALASKFDPGGLGARIINFIETVIQKNPGKENLPL
jgi:hypothetical protein